MAMFLKVLQMLQDEALAMMKEIKENKKADGNKTMQEIIGEALKQKVKEM